MTIMKYISKVAGVIGLIAIVEGEKVEDEVFQTTHKQIRGLAKASLPVKGADTQVLIGGAGFSGVAAAEEFNAAGLKFWIAEATDHVGGRIHGDLFGKAAGGNRYYLEHGANYVQGLTGNPVWQMAQNYGLDGHPTKFYNVRVYDENGVLNITESFFLDGSNCGAAAAAVDYLTDLSTYCLELNKGDSFVNDTVKQFCLSALGAKFKPSNNDDISCQQGEILGGFYPPNAPNPAVARLCQWYSLELEDLEPVQKLSTIYTVPDYNSIVYDEDFYYVRDPRGYKWVVESTGANFLSTSTSTASTIVFNDPRLNLNTKVIKVQWNPKGGTKVQVTLCQTQKVIVPNSPILYPCIANKDYITVTANYFFSTFSLGVLKASLNAERTGLATQGLQKTRDVAPVFVPPLSSVPPLAGAIKTIGYSLFQRVYFQFPFAFWPKGVDILLSAYSQGKWLGEFAPGWLSLDLQSTTDTRYYPGSNTLCLTVVGARAIELSDSTDDAVVAQILPVLNLMFASQIQAANSGKLLSSSDVLDFYLPRWHADPLFRGSYSTNLINAPVSLLGDRYGNLVFSGEVTCHSLNAYVHGAYFAGKRSARLLMARQFGVKGLDLSSVCDTFNIS